MNRANWFVVSPEGAKAVGQLHHFATAGTSLPPKLVDLVFLRVSQLNGCAHCIDIHTRDLLKEGMPFDTIALLPVWHEAAYLFSEQERAALAWAEEVTLVSETHASDEAYEKVAAVFCEKDLVDLTLTIAAMNAINRMGVSFRLKPRAKPAAEK
ncbi:carboxymuconolactone decarboxylase family protein [Stenotrophomonas maltophilia]|uniref:Alkylhydroperoxidase n=1 Tax=Stenotrophomonas maltophilia TaxID=40324 RepID=A0AAP7L181_STEMA|nr:carboxymuconolactone decarboxylase family protein [Stenotrophomonas maltophilia]MCO7399708.1 carboxymuconolactone decarboxylase family protein [Stenotrophomonas maltophilia]MCO7411538.1 carboxymuconolactone decarboxylase family protein [Stenotrophomonas maltophilia]OBU61990.1 alkylhydroperoxidase [Stenotrophomonas maltophilia]HDS1221239.1 carboxymuconolactone decarboxylase family protein [Stenotrophomonas maltophilia]HDS1231531.1 carboxymuconolactone decarboxylase family protein [Stenotroph